MCPDKDKNSQVAITILYTRMKSDKTKYRVHKVCWFEGQDIENPGKFNEFHRERMKF